MKIGSKDGKFYVGWYCKDSGKVVYTWFDRFDQAMNFMNREG